MPGWSYQIIYQSSYVESGRYISVTDDASSISIDLCSCICVDGQDPPSSLFGSLHRTRLVFVAFSAQCPFHLERKEKGERKGNEEAVQEQKRKKTPPSLPPSLQKPNVVL